MARKRKPTQRQQVSSAKPADSGGLQVRAQQTPEGQTWELVHPRCARERAEDLQEVEKMIAAGESEIARDELRWLLDGCSDCLLAHKLLGELALGEGDLRLARAHFGYAFELGRKALDRAGVRAGALYRTPANQSFFEAGKGLAYCLRELGKPALVAEVVGRMLQCDPSDPLGLAGFLDNPQS